MILKDEKDVLFIIQELLTYPNETEWIEFKHNNTNPDEIGEYISALSNSATINGKIAGYMVWGIDDKTKQIIGTDFHPSQEKKGNQELENWLISLIEPKINFRFYEVTIDRKNVVLLEIEPAFKHPVKFKKEAFIRVGSYKKKLKDVPQKEKELWIALEKIPFELIVAADKLTADDILKVLDYTKYFELLDLPLPESKELIIETFIEDGLVKKHNGQYAITNLGAILFAKNLNKFTNLKRKAIRVIEYKDNTKFETKKEKIFEKGYAVSFENIVEYISDILPSNEVIEKVYRKTSPMYPEIAIRELTANAIIHQDFFQTGTSVMIEIFPNRIEFTNPGIPLIKTDRFLDAPPKSRNEMLASFFRRVNICEERGSGVDKVVIATERYQLPAPLFETGDNFTRVILFAHKELKDMEKEDKIRACYLHCCLKYIQRDFMTNASLRERFNIDAKNTAMVSRIIKDALEVKKIYIYDETVGTKARKYIPYWAK